MNKKFEDQRYENQTRLERDAGIACISGGRPALRR